METNKFVADKGEIFVLLQDLYFKDLEFNDIFQF